MPAVVAVAAAAAVDHAGKFVMSWHGLRILWCIHVRLVSLDQR